jgi:flagellar biosynthesis/type III secretory pathway M-ring protein FliF/YscJ
VERTEERFEPTPVTRQETRTVETTKGSATTPTVPAGAPTPGAPQPPPSSTSNEGTRESESVSYELSKIVARTLTSPGEIQRLSVSVLLNSNSRVAQASDKKEVREPVPRSPEEVDKIRRIVMGAVGYSQARGDEVTVVEMPFDTSLRDREQSLLDRGDPSSPLGGLGGSANTLVLVAVVLAALVLVAWFIRNQGRQRALAEVARSLHTQDARPIGATADFAAAAHEPEAPVMPGVPEEFLRISKERDGVRQKAMGLASTEPEAAAQLIRAWMVKKKTPHTAGAGHDGK